jgi:hypothetical protein
MNSKNKKNKTKSAEPSARSKAIKRFFEACLEALAASAEFPHF